MYSLNYGKKMGLSKSNIFILCISHGLVRGENVWVGENVFSNLNILES